MKKKLPPLGVEDSLNERDLLIALLSHTVSLHANSLLMYKHLQGTPTWPTAKEPDTLYAECYAVAHHDLQATLTRLARGKR